MTQPTPLHGPNRQRLQPHPPLLPPHSTTPPIHATHPPQRGRVAQRLEQLHIDVDAPVRAPHARVHNLDVLDRDVGVRVVDGDGGAAEGVGVGVGGVVHLEVGDGDDVLAGGGGDVARGELGDGGGGVEG